jgi:dephospho-CoA kinase
MILIGLTGGISCGKSTVCRMLHERHGLLIIDCDEIVRGLQQPGMPCVMDIQKEWPQCVDSGTRALRREVLSEIVFRDPSARRRLAEIMNRRVFLAIFRRILSAWWSSGRAEVVILDAPLLFETNVFTKLISASIAVVCGEALQLTRLVSRNQLTEEAARNRVNAQMPLSKKAKLADFVLSNDAGLEELQHDVDEAFTWMQRQARMKLTAMITGTACCVVGFVAAAAFFVARFGVG